ncbi:MAG: hypothetical protein QM786_07495 [Breznakibacter sp.]
MKKAVLILSLALGLSAFVNAQTKTVLKPADLPKTITENISKDFSGYTIEKATKVTANSATTYEVIVQKGTDKEKLAYNADGKFLKKEAMVQKVAHNSQPKTSAGNKSGDQHKTQK